LFAVARGKYSEGINFKDEYCRGIIMVGVPNQYIESPKMRMKEIFY
jgi:Rad3-related DNA helicase